MASSFWEGLQVQKVDLVWGTSPPIFQGVTAWLLARFKGVPLLFEVRDLWPAFAIEVGVLRNPILIRLSRWLEKFLYRRADTVMVNSPGFITHVSERGAKRVKLIPNGADAEMFDPFSSGIEFRRRHGLEGRFVALYAGAHGMSNDLDVILDAAVRLANQADIALVLVGDGKEKPRLQQRAAGLGLRNLYFIEPVAKAEMASALAAASACIAILKPVPMYATVYPNKVFDYMAAGRPVILAIDGVIREVVENAQAGVFVEPGDPDALADAVLRLANDPVLRSEMGRNARAYVVEHFNRPALAGQLEAVLQKMIE